MNAGVAEPFTTRLVLSARLTSELTDLRGRLRAIGQCSRSAVIIYAGGEVDAFNEDIWQRLINEGASAARSAGSFVVDLNGMSFVACCAFRILADQAALCRRRKVALRLVSHDPQVTRSIAACGFSATLPVHPTASDALSALP